MENILILASASARRKKILMELGVQFNISIPDTNEVTFSNDPRRTVAENAMVKSQWAITRHPGKYIISADTIVALDNIPIAKPSSILEASDFLRSFSGRTQYVYTGVSLYSPSSGEQQEVVESTVKFKTLTYATIKAYFAKVNPMDKAGAYDIDQHSDMIIESFTGSFTNIMGLPIETVAPWLKKEGFL